MSRSKNLPPYSLVDLGNLEERELAGDRDVRCEVAASDHADGGDWRARPDELGLERAVGELGADVGVLGLEDHADEAAITIEEIVFVREPERVPVDVGRHVRTGREEDAIEHEVPREDHLRFVVDRRVFESKLVALVRAQHDLQLLEPALLDAEILDEVDPGAGDACQGLADDEDRRRRIPEQSRKLHVIVLAGRPRRGHAGLPVRRRGHHRHRDQTHRHYDSAF